MQTGENTEGLRKIIDLTRKASIGMLCLHCYYYCYHSFDQWGLTHPISERLLVNIQDTGLFNEFYLSKVFALGLLLISLIGAKGKKDDKLRMAQVIWPLISGLVSYEGSLFVFYLPFNEDTLSIIYIIVTSIGFILILRGGGLLSRLLKNRFDQGVSAKEALNLLEGRAVFKSMFNKEGERYNAWLQLDLGSKDEKGQHPVTQYHQNYGFKLEDAVKQFPLKDLKQPDRLDLLLYSLKKGNRHEVEIEGNDSKFLLEANPRYKTMNLYDAEGKRMKFSVLKAAQDLVKAEAKKDPQTKNRSKGVKV